MNQIYKKYLIIFLAALALGFVAGVYVVWRDFSV